MTLTDNVHAAVRTLAQLTHMNQDAAMVILDLLVHMDQRAVATIPERERSTEGSLPAMLAALCGTELAQDSQVCTAWAQMGEGR
ncbi:MAG: hypothetical protein QM692_21120 [Thermomicrobiales bacterium]